MKLPKNLLKRNSWTFYIPEEFFPIWQEFILELDKDEDLKALHETESPNNRGRLISVGLRTAIKMYLRARHVERELEVESGV